MINRNENYLNVLSVVSLKFEILFDKIFTLENENQESLKILAWHIFVVAATKSKITKLEQLYKMMVISLEFVVFKIVKDAQKVELEHSKNLRRQQVDRGKIKSRLGIQRSKTTR